MSEIKAMREEVLQVRDIKIFGKSFELESGGKTPACMGRSGIWITLMGLTNSMMDSKIKPMIHDLFEKNAVGARTAILNKENTADVWHDRRILTIGNSLDVTNAMWDLIDDRNTQYTNSFVIK